MKKLLDSARLQSVQFKCNTNAKSVTPVQIMTKASEVSPKKPGEPWRLPKLNRGIPKITKVYPKASEDYRRVLKITRSLPKIFEDYQIAA